MSNEHLAARPPTITLMYSGWQVWAGEHGPVRAGGELTASVEFVQRSRPRVAQSGRRPLLEHTRENWYQAVASVLDTTDAVVLDLGAFRALRWVRPGEGTGDFQRETAVEFELSLNINPWTDSPWTNRAADLYGTNYRWSVDRILRFSTATGEAVELDEATMETVESSAQYCLLDCVVLG
jgi:hypothetical protein